MTVGTLRAGRWAVGTLSDNGVSFLSEGGPVLCQVCKEPIVRPGRSPRWFHKSTGLPYSERGGPHVAAPSPPVWNEPAEQAHGLLGSYVVTYGPPPAMWHSACDTAWPLPDLRSDTVARLAADHDCKGR